MDACDVDACHVHACHVDAYDVDACHVDACHVDGCHVHACHVHACHVDACHVHACHVDACHVHACRVDAYYERVTIATHNTASVAMLLLAHADRSNGMVQKYAVLIQKQRPLHGVFTDMPSFCSSAERAGSFIICNLPRQLDQLR